MINLLFYSKNNEPTPSIGQHSRSEWFSEEEETIYRCKRSINQWLFSKFKDGQKQQKTFMTNKNIKAIKDDHQKYQRRQLAKTTRTVNDNNNQQYSRDNMGYVLRVFKSRRRSHADTLEISRNSPTRVLLPALESMESKRYISYRRYSTSVYIQNH